MSRAPDHVDAGASFRRQRRLAIELQPRRQLFLAFDCAGQQIPEPRQPGDPLVVPATRLQPFTPRAVACGAARPRASASAATRVSAHCAGRRLSAPRRTKASRRSSPSSWPGSRDGRGAKSLSGRRCRTPGTGNRAVASSSDRSSQIGFSVPFSARAGKALVYAEHRRRRDAAGRCWNSFWCGISQTSGFAWRCF